MHPADRKKHVNEKPILDDELIEACRREQQDCMGYSDTRDELARKIVDLLRNHPEFTRTQVITQVGLTGTPSYPAGSPPLAYGADMRPTPHQYPDPVPAPTPDPMPDPLPDPEPPPLPPDISEPPTA